MKNKVYIISVVATLLIASCSSDSPKDLVDVVPVSGNVTFTQYIKPITDGNCISCHGTVPSGGAPMSLTNYAEVKDALLNRGLIDRITKAPGDALLMPQGGPKLPQNKIDLVMQWQVDGLLE